VDYIVLSLYLFDLDNYRFDGCMTGGCALRYLCCQSNQNNMKNQKVSKGLGLTLINKLISQGHRVAATSRRLNDLENAAGKHESFLPLEVNLTSEESVSAALEATVVKFGSIDVVVNNAGYGLVGGLEELSDAESRSNFDVNVFGMLNVIRKVLPQMRKQRSGHIFNVSSVGGFTGSFPGFGIYCATKFAVHGLSESLATEVESFGIKVTIVSPGYFRTNFLDSSLATPSSAIEAYEAVRASQAMHQDQINGNQPNDPEKAADVFIKAADLDQAPLHLFLGHDAYEMVNQKIRNVEREMELLKDLATSTAFND
jgi:NAD(P)-dependent dehydrogenase (short-subunit alcohol dehydrogenase family)